MQFKLEQPKSIMFNSKAQIKGWSIIEHIPSNFAHNIIKLDSQGLPQITGLTVTSMVLLVKSH